MRARFGDFLLDSDRRVLERAGSPVHITAKALTLLEILVAEAPRAIPKRELIEALWRGPTGFILPLKGGKWYQVAFSPNGTWLVTSSVSDKVLVFSSSGGTPIRVTRARHSRRSALWFARSMRVWPMPDLSKPPLHTLAYDALITKLKTLTNLRIVADATAPNGYKFDYAPFPGWENVPDW